MKKTIKHLTSLCLALVMCMSICVPAFAGFSPDSSHERYVYEYTNYVHAADISISETEADNRDVFYNLLSGSIGVTVARALNGVENAAGYAGVLAIALTEVAVRSDPLYRYGDYSISVRYLTKYSVNMYTGKRTKVDQWICAKYDLSRNGALYDTEERQVRMK